MNTATFDTHAALRALTRAGVATEHAEAIADTVRIAVSEGVATKTDIADMRADIAALDAKIAALETRLTVRMVALGGAIVAVMAALKFFG